MSDAQVEPAPATPIAPPSGYSGEPPAPPAPYEAPVESDPMVDPFEYGQQQFPRAYVEQLRNEAAQRRVAARQAEEALAPYQAGFAGLSDEDIQTVLQFTRTLSVDPDAAAEWMVSTGQMIQDQRAQAQAAISGAFIDDQSELVGQQRYDANDPNRPWTVADQQRWEAEQQYRAQTSQLIGHWNREADRLGYNPNATPNDPGGPGQWLQFQQLVKMAEFTGGNLEAAHNILVQQTQGAVNQQLQSRVETVRGMTRQAPPAAAANGDHEVSDSERWQRINAAVRDRIGGEPIQ